MKPWPIVRLGEVLTPTSRGESPVPGTTYRQIGVKLWGEGAYEREPMDGGEIFYDAAGGPRLIPGTPPLLETGVLIEADGTPRGGTRP
jgi:hypothetical protein